MSAGLLAVACIAGVLAGTALWLLSSPDLLVVLGSRVARVGALWSVWRIKVRADRKSVGAGDRSILGRVDGFIRSHISRTGDRSLKEVERARCLDELPELVDVVALGLSAGISFDAALQIYCDRHQTMLAALMSDAMRSWRLGMASRKEALSNLAKRLEVPAFTMFADTVSESLEFGAPLARTLTEQADSIRLARRSALQEQIEKAPVKMLVPTGVLVLPALLLAILGPLMSSLVVTTG